MIAIIQHFIPDINFELEGLKAAGAKFGIATPAPPLPGQTPRRSLPPSLEAAYLQRFDSTPGQSDAMSERSPSLDPSEFEEEEEGDVTAAGHVSTIVEPRLNEQPLVVQSAALEKRNSVLYSIS